MGIRRAHCILAMFCVLLVTQTVVAQKRSLKYFLPPTQLKADGEPINTGDYYRLAHAGPWLADFDGDGCRDLVVGTFEGAFQLFKNTGCDTDPTYKSIGKLRAGDAIAKTPIY